MGGGGKGGGGEGENLTDFQSVKDPTCVIPGFQLGKWFILILAT